MELEHQPRELPQKLKQNIATERLDHFINGMKISENSGLLSRVLQIYRMTCQVVSKVLLPSQKNEI